MIMAWLTYCLLVAALLGVAASLGERAFRWQGWPLRWAWAGALAGSLALPAWAWLRPLLRAGAEPATPLVPLPGAYVMEALSPLALAPAGPAGPSLEAVLGLSWVASSAALLLWLAVSGLRLRRAGRGWLAGEVDGVPVLVSETTGPAAVGLFRGRVVLPGWALSLDDRLRRLLVLHEAEHVRARDPQLAVAGLVACALMPWNPALWWQLARLRLAIEVDCDARVLRRADDAPAYGTLLLKVGERRARLALGLAESRSMLERRIRMLTRRDTGRRTVRALGLGAAAALAVAVACETPGPTGVADGASRPMGAEDAVASLRAFPCDPLVYLNGDLVDASVLETLEPSSIDMVEVIRGSAALRAEEVRSERAERAPTAEPTDGCGVIFVLTKDAPPEARARIERLSAERRGRRGAERPAVSLEDVEDGPTFTPMTARPELRNVREVQEALLRHYPPLLRNAGIGGTANVWLLIDPEGRVHDSRIHEGSGYDALDQAALRVAAVMQFSPGYNGDTPVPVWVSLPIKFELSDAAAPPVRSGTGLGPVSAPENSPTPLTRLPRLVNPQEVAQALRGAYPPLLRDAGIGGTVHIWFYIDERGLVTRTQINESSGHDALDQAALRVADVLRFEPARNGDEVVAAWIALPVTFEIQ